MNDLKRPDSDELGLTGLWGNFGRFLNGRPQTEANSLHRTKWRIRDPGSEPAGPHTGGCDCRRAHLSDSHGRK